MGIHVDGNDNRVAGRDYYELRIKPCPACELRLIEPEATVCNHCHRAQAEENAKGIISLGGVGIFVVFISIMRWRSDHGLPINLEATSSALVASVITVLAGAGLLWLIHVWWKLKR